MKDLVVKYFRAMHKVAVKYGNIMKVKDYLLLENCPGIKRPTCSSPGLDNFQSPKLLSISS